MPSLLLGAGSLGMMILVTSWIANHISDGFAGCSGKWRGSRRAISRSST